MSAKQPRYRDADWLREEYYEKERPLTDIADELGVDHTTVSKWRRRLGVPKPTATVEMDCPVCGSEFTRTKSKADRAKHANVCSRECLYEARSEGIIGREVVGGYDTNPSVLERECKGCGDTFHTTPAEDYTHCSRECFLDAHSDRMSGDGNPSYVDGASKERRCYRGPNWARVRRRVYERDGYTCQRCGRDCISRQNYDRENGDLLIQAHHIDPYESPDDNELDNLVTLCARCHGEVEGGEPLNVE